MSQIIIYANESGGVSLCAPSGEIPIEDVQRKDTPAGSRIVEDTTLPDREFFDAWELANDVVNINFPKAQALTKDRLRLERKPLLEAQDVLFQRALETGKDATAIVKEKQRLRDVTKLVDAATTLDQLKGVTV